MNTRTEARMQRIEDLIQRIVHDIGENAQQAADIYILANEIPRHPKTLGGSLLDSTKTINQCDVNPNATRFKPDQQRSDFHCSVATCRRRWYQQWRIGSIKVEVSQNPHRVNGLLTSNSIVMMIIHFRPSQSILRFPEISIVYETGTNQQGYRQLAPMIAIYPILDALHPVWKVIKGGELQCLQHMLASRKVQIRSADRDGSILLHVSIKSCLYIFSVICVFSGQSHVALRLEGMPKRIKIGFSVDQYTVCCQDQSRGYLYIPKRPKSFLASIKCCVSQRETAIRLDSFYYSHSAMPIDNVIGNLFPISGQHSRRETLKMLDVFDSINCDYELILQHPGQRFGFGFRFHSYPSPYWNRSYFTKIIRAMRDTAPNSWQAHASQIFALSTLSPDILQHKITGALFNEGLDVLIQTSLT